MILPPPIRACREDAAELALAALGEAEFRRLTREGSGLSEDEAVALGLPERAATVAA